MNHIATDILITICERLKYHISNYDKYTKETNTPNNYYIDLYNKYNISPIKHNALILNNNNSVKKPSINKFIINLVLDFFIDLKKNITKNFKKYL